MQKQVGKMKTYVDIEYESEKKGTIYIYIYIYFRNMYRE